MQNSLSQSYVRPQSASLPNSLSSVPSLNGGSRREGAGFDERTPPHFVGRSHVTRTILGRLASGGGAGCILVGAAGSGKTALIHHVLRQCSPDTYVVHVRGSAFSGRTPFGALTFLLSDLEPEVANHPVLILRGLTRLIQERAQGRAVLLAVDNGEDLDEFSAMALSQMVLSRTAGLLACFRDFSRAPAEFAGLWREGILSRVDLEPLGVAETAELMSAALDGPVSGSAVAHLHRSTGGNPHLLQLGCEDYRDAGKLRLSGNVWVLDHGTAAPVGRVAETVLAQLGTLTDSQLTLLRTVAMAGSLPLSAALHSVDSDDVDTLQENGILALEQGNAPRIMILDPVLVSALCSSADSATRKKLLNQLREVAAAALPPGDPAAGTEPLAAVLDPARLARWRLDAGERLDLESAVEAARAAGAAGNFRNAIRFITACENYAGNPAAVLELVSAHMALEDYAAALSVLASSPARSGGAAPRDEVLLLIAENRLLCMAATGALSAADSAALLPPGAAKKHEELLARAEQRVAGMVADGTVSRAEAAALKRKLVLARAECNSAHGRFLENAVFLAPLQAEAAGQEKTFRVLTGSWLCEALGMTDRQDEAAEVSREVERLLGEPGISRSDRTRAFARIIHVHLAVGALDSARRLLQQQSAHGKAAMFPGLLGELAEGLLNAYAGEPAPALRSLVPAVAQLRLSGPASLLPLATSAAAYCFALQKDREGAETYLQLRAKAGDGGPWSMRRAARHFAALANGSLGSPQAARRFVELAGHDHRRGAYSYELLSLLNAARLGDVENLDRILSVAAHQQGPFPRMCEVYAKGVGSFDAQLLIQASELGKASGHVLFAAEASERALAVASGAGDRATVRLIHRSRRGPEVSAAEGADSADEYLSALTFRERSIARMAAAGTSNKAIAADLNISVRTVEGHLYQVYSKLHVGSRRELAKVIAEKSAVRP